jgi:DNA-binding IclR family transcriptional regulator
VAEHESGIRPSPSAARATQILGFLARHPRASFTVSEIARTLGLNRATCHSVLLALEEASYVRREERTKGYSLGPAPIGVGEAARSSMTVVGEARPEVERLAATTGLECVAAVASGEEMVVIATAGPRDRFGGVIRVGYTYPLCPPFATAVVAWGDEAAVESWLGRAGPLSEEQRKHYLASLDAVRRRGHSVTLEIKDATRLGEALAALRFERDTDASAEEHLRVNQLLQQEYTLPEAEELGSHRVEQITVPVFGVDGRVALVIGLTGFAHDVALDEANTYVAPLLAAAHRITGRFGS